MMKRVMIVERRILAGIIYPWKAVCGESRMHGLGWGEVIYVSSLSVLVLYGDITDERYMY